MQCSRCDYIRFKSASKCVNCGFDFKSKKSTHNVSGDTEHEFTIFAVAGTQAVAASVATDTEMNFQEPLSSEELFGSQETLLEETDSALEPPEAYIQESGDFELNLSDMDNPDSEDWVVGATLTEDLAEISNFDSKDPAESSMTESNEFAVQGLGFDAAEDTEEIEPMDKETASSVQDSAMDSEPTVVDEEMAVQEMEPYASKSEITFTPENDGPELSESALRDLDPGHSLDIPADESGDISLETELDLETKNSEFDRDRESSGSGEISLDIQDNSVDLDPMLELEELDLALEIESPETENSPQGSSQTSDATFEDPNHKKDAGDDNAPLLPKENS
jgi:hypothetical protein